ncbi:hypothetical protein ACROYT_G015254 [Oculina patagonica]
MVEIQEINNSYIIDQSHVVIRHTSEKKWFPFFCYNQGWLSAFLHHLYADVAKKSKIVSYYGDNLDLTLIVSVPDYGFTCESSYVASSPLARSEIHSTHCLNCLNSLHSHCHLQKSSQEVLDDTTSLQKSSQQYARVPRNRLFSARLKVSYNKEKESLQALNYDYVSYEENGNGANLGGKTNEEEREKLVKVCTDSEIANEIIRCEFTLIYFAF